MQKVGVRAVEPEAQEHRRIAVDETLAARMRLAEQRRVCIGEIGVADDQLGLEVPSIGQFDARDRASLLFEARDRDAVSVRGAELSAEPFERARAGAYRPPDSECRR